MAGSWRLAGSHLGLPLLAAPCGWSVPLTRSVEEVGAGEVAGPLLVLVRCPALIDDEQLPGVGVVDRPEDVGRFAHVELGLEVGPFV